jgi:hypothetical protein
MDDEPAPKGAIPATDEQLGQLAGKLLETLQQGGTESIDSLLEQIYHYFREKTWKQSSSEALLHTWSACALLLNEEDLSPEVREAEPKMINFSNARVDQLCKNGVDPIQGSSLARSFGITFSELKPRVP